VMWIIDRKFSGIGEASQEDWNEDKKVAQEHTFRKCIGVQSNKGIL
jgi:hypothetical protein